MNRTVRQPSMPARAAAATKSAPAKPAPAAPPAQKSAQKSDQKSDQKTAAKAMNRLDLVNAVAEGADLAKTDAGKVVDTVFKVIEGALKQGQEVRLTGFGTFATSVRKATTGRNPRTGEEIAIGESTSVRFKAGKALKDSVG